jgi:hypothetical protein
MPIAQREGVGQFGVQIHLPNAARGEPRLGPFQSGSRPVEAPQQPPIAQKMLGRREVQRGDMEDRDLRIYYRLARCNLRRRLQQRLLALIPGRPGVINPCHER